MAFSSVRTAPRHGFDFTSHIRLLAVDMVHRLPELAHIDLERVAVSFSQTRSVTHYGLQATLTPMRFESGATTTERGGRRYEVERLYDAAGREYLYILSFYLPRFLNLPLKEKVSTVLHELWHISPRFDGDLRRHSGRCYAHGPSQKQYDAQIERLASKWWSLHPPESLYSFLRHTFAELQTLHGQVFGTRIPNPKLIPV